jgi:hypothetical protein
MWYHMYVRKLFEAKSRNLHGNYRHSLPINAILLRDIILLSISHLLVMVALFYGAAGHILALLHFYVTMGYRPQPLRTGLIVQHEQIYQRFLLHLTVCVTHIVQRKEFRVRGEFAFVKLVIVHCFTFDVGGC